MSLNKLPFLFFIIGLASCSTNPNYDGAASCGSATPLCLAAVIVGDIVTGSTKPSKKCSEVEGAQRKACEEQVKSLKEHIKKANNKYNKSQKNN